MLIIFLISKLVFNLINITTNGIVNFILNNFIKVYRDVMYLMLNLRVNLGRI